MICHPLTHGCLDEVVEAAVLPSRLDPRQGEKVGVESHIDGFTHVAKPSKIFHAKPYNPESAYYQM